MKNLLRVERINKSFGALKALDNIDFEILEGEIIGLVGDNGAGKSTLIKIISGVLQPDSGDIYFDQKLVKIKNVSDARKLGIETLYQDHTLVDHLSVAKNIFLSREHHYKLGFIKIANSKLMEEKARSIVKEMGLPIDPRSLAKSLSGGERQTVALARSKYFKMRLLLLDEPTTHLSVKETQILLNYLKELAQNRVSIIFVTHTLEHAHLVADRFIILEEGKKILDIEKEKISSDKISQVIMGKKFE